MGQFGRLDCLINNAGWHPGHKPIDDFSVQDFRTLLDLNLVSIFAACKFALPHLRKVKGNIINISSLVGAIGQLHATTYVATKGAITAFTKALAIDEAEHEVRVNSVSPGNVYTPLWQEAIDASEDPAATRATGDAAQLLGRMGTIEEAGRLCLYLAAEATFTTGSITCCRGGRIGVRTEDAATAIGAYLGLERRSAAAVGAVRQSCQASALATVLFSVVAPAIAARIAVRPRYGACYRRHA